MKLLIVRGYGTFGGRIVQLLESEPRLTLLVAGRSLARPRPIAKDEAAPSPGSCRSRRGFYRGWLEPAQASSTT
ncbi:MAG: hypothetical protein E5X93_01830, partial [Mesorhizobium sp.]